MLQLNGEGQKLLFYTSKIIIVYVYACVQMSTWAGAYEGQRCPFSGAVPLTPWAICSDWWYLSILNLWIVNVLFCQKVAADVLELAWGDLKGLPVFSVPITAWTPLLTKYCNKYLWTLNLLRQPSALASHPVSSLVSFWNKSPTNINNEFRSGKYLNKILYFILKATAT